MRLKTERGYDLGEVVSALQKAIRRGDERLALYFALELCGSLPAKGTPATGTTKRRCYAAYLWRRLLVISAEDCFAPLTAEIEALQRAHVSAKTTWIFVAKAVVLLVRAAKSRDADHGCCLVYDRKFGIDDAEIAVALAAQPPDELLDIPEYALDCHTARGKRAGKTKEQFLVAEHAALSPRAPGLFDGLIGDFGRRVP